MNTVSHIIIKHRGHDKADVETNMPILKHQDGGLIHIVFPLLGNLDTFCRKDENIDDAIIEAISCFIIASQKFGSGISKELGLLGWSPIKRPTWRNSKNRPTSTTFNIERRVPLAKMHSSKAKSLQLQDD